MSRERGEQQVEREWCVRVLVRVRVLSVTSLNNARPSHDLGRAGGKWPAGETDCNYRCLRRGRRTDV